MRSCTKCGIAKPLTDFSADSCKPSGYGSHCKQCKKEAAAARRAADPEKYLEIARKYRERNPEVVSSSRKKCYSKNAEVYRELSRKWKRNNPAKVAESSARWREQNPELALMASRKNRLAWQARNRDYARAQLAKYRASRGNRTLSKLNLDAEIKAIYKKAAAISSATGIQHHVDHMVPLHGKTVSGLHVPWNLQVIPAYDNRRKSNKHKYDTLENLK